MKIIHRKTAWQGPLLAAGLALIIMSAILTLRGITPFGDHNLLISDMGGQYLSFFTAYRHALLNHSFQLYSFSQSLGGNTVPTIAYYLLSPFNLLILAFPVAKIPTGLTVIIIIKVMAIALSMTVFLQRHFQTTARSTAIFGVAFSLSGFVALNYFTIMWLDALIWLPLVIMGLEHLLDTGRPGPFFWWLWISIVTDYYLGYMTCLFVIYYFVYQLYERTLPGETLWQTIRQNGPRVRRVILTALLSGLSSLFILIPTGLGMLKTAKSAIEPSSYAPVLQFGLDFFSALGLGATNYVTRLEHAPTVFCTTFVVLLAAVFFVHPRFERRHKFHVAGLLLALFLSMAIRTLDTAWHMFQQPAGFPYRDAFFFSFVLIMIAMAAWQAEAKRIKSYWTWILPTGLGLLLILGWLQRLHSSQPLDWSTLLFSLLFVLTDALILFTTTGRARCDLITFISACELLGNGWLAMAHSPWGNQTTYERAYRAEYRQMQAVNDPDGQLYRVENRNTLINRAYNYDAQYRNYNDPMLFNFHDITYYSSTFDNQTRLMLRSLGLFSKNARRVSSEGLNSVSELLLGLKYDVILNALGQSQTLTLPNQVGMGFAVPDQFTRVKLSGNDAIVNQERILQGLQSRSKSYLTAASTISDHVTTAPHATKYHYLHHLTLRVHSNGPLYYDDTRAASKVTTMRVNDHLIPSKFNADGYSVLRTLGTFNTGDVVKLTVKQTTAKNDARVRIATLNQQRFKRVVHQLRSSTFVPKYHVSGFTTTVSGTINNPKHRHWLYVAIPSDSGWHARVNGQTVGLKTVINGMLAVPIKGGQNHVVLTYHVPGLRLGGLISLASLVTFEGLEWRRRHLRRL